MTVKIRLISILSTFVTCFLCAPHSAGKRGGLEDEQDHQTDDEAVASARAQPRIMVLLILPEASG